MSCQVEDWDEVFARYRVSGLSQARFCSQNDISINQFHYRWYECNERLKEQGPLEEFESISVIESPNTAVVSSIEMTIRLPNKISCEVSIGLDGLSGVLQALVQLC